MSSIMQRRNCVPNEHRGGALCLECLDELLGCLVSMMRSCVPSV
jgi:hypothetical protein